MEWVGGEVDVDRRGQLPDFTFPHLGLLVLGRGGGMLGPGVPEEEEARQGQGER